LLAVALLGVRLVTPDFFWHMTAPLFRVGDAVAGANHTFLSSFGHAAGVAAENDALRKENESLVAMNALLAQKVEQLSPDNAEGLRVKGQGDLRADVVARPPESPYDVLTLARGSRDGVAVGMEAFAPSGAPLGVVAQVSDDFSRVVLFSSPNRRTAGWVGRESVPVTIIGAGGGALHISLSRAANIVVGDVVYVPGPGMLPLGVVGRVDDDPSSPAVTLRVRPLSNPFSVGSVALRATGIRGSADFLVASSTPQ